MKKWNVLLAVLFFITACTKTDQKKSIAATPETKPVSDECVLIAEISDPKQKDEYPMQLCMYTQTETRGIFVATACVGVLIEGQSGTRNAFYGSKGHWGIEGTCEEKKIADKFKDPETMKTVNPISDLKMKRKQGKAVKILKDDFHIGELLLQVTKP